MVGVRADAIGSGYVVGRDAGGACLCLDAAALDVATSDGDRGGLGGESHRRRIRRLHLADTGIIYASVGRRSQAIGDMTI